MLEKISKGKIEKNQKENWTMDINLYFTSITLKWLISVVN